MLKRSLILCWLLFFKVSAQHVEILLDDKVEMNVFLGHSAPTEISHSTHKLLFDKLQDNIQFHYLSHYRSFELLETNTDKVVCKVNKLMTPKRKINFLFSLPINVYLGVRLYQNNQSPLLNKQVFNGSKQISSLESIFKYHQNAVIAIENGVSYTNELDIQLTKVPSKNTLVISYFGSGNFDLLYTLFTQNRADFILAYPADIFRKNNDLQDNFRTYSIFGSKEYVTGHLMCNKSKQSQIFIQKVNKKLLEIYKKESFIEEHMKYLPFNEKQHIKSIITRLTKMNEF